MWCETRGLQFVGVFSVTQHIFPQKNSTHPPATIIVHGTQLIMPIKQCLPTQRLFHYFIITDRWNIAVTIAIIIIIVIVSIAQSRWDSIVQ